MAAISNKNMASNSKSQARGQALPNELFEMIAFNLEGKDLKNFRLASNATAAMGSRPLRNKFCDSVEYSDYPDLNVIEFIDEILEVPATMPGCADSIKKLCVETPYRPHEKVPDSFANIRLPRLEHLSLAGVIVDSLSLEMFLRLHAKTLRSVSMRDVALNSRCEPGSANSYASWTNIFKIMRNSLHLKSLDVHHLTWHDSALNTTSDIYLRLPRAKYHRRIIRRFSETDIDYQLNNGGVHAKGGVSHAIRMFLKQVKKEKDRLAILNGGSSAGGRAPDLVDQLLSAVGSNTARCYARRSRRPTPEKAAPVPLLTPEEYAFFFPTAGGLPGKSVDNTADEAIDDVPMGNASQDGYA